MSIEVDHDLLRLFTGMADPLQRWDAADETARALGAEALIIFIEDAEVGSLNPAPGFPQTLPGRRSWQDLLHNCTNPAACRAEVSYPDSSKRVAAVGVKSEDGSILVLLGGSPDMAAAEEAARYVPLLAAVFRREQSSRAAKEQVRIAVQTATQVTAIARALDETRIELQAALQTAASTKERLEHELVERREAQEALREQKKILEIINRVNATLAAELDLNRLAQKVIDAATKLTKAQYGVFLYNVLDESGESCILHAASGVKRETFSESGLIKDPQCINRGHGHAILRVSDIREDPRLKEKKSMLLLPDEGDDIRSYLAVPVISRGQEVLGGLFFGHPEAGVFSAREEKILSGIADQTAIAIENARLYQRGRLELAERKVAEAELKNLNETLEQRVSVRTADLERANDELKFRNRELQEFAYIASHDLQEPLRKIRMFSDLLLSRYAERLDDTGSHYLDRIFDAADRMSTLISDLLTYSRVTTQTEPYQFVDLNEVLSEVVADLHVLISETAGRIEVSPLPRIEADATQVRQIFQNLLSNALKFHKPGEAPVVSINGSVVRVSGESGTTREICRILVEDNGIGFEPQYSDRIFAPFQRLHTKDEFEGTGIGLAVCRRIAERHGGSVEVESAPGVGTKFILQMPVRQNINVVQHAMGSS